MKKQERNGFSSWVGDDRDFADMLYNREMTRKEVKIFTSANLFDIYELCGDVDVVAEKIKAIPRIARERYPDVQAVAHAHRFSIDTTRNYDDGIDLEITAWRWETDEELDKRLKLNKQQAKTLAERKLKEKEKKEQRERKIYEELKKKYDK